MKKVLAIVLCLVMALSVFTGCKKTSDEPEEVVAAEIPEAKYHFSFDDATGLTAVNQVEKAADSINDGATYDLAESNSTILFANGPVGNCLYLDGKYGVKLDMEALNTDAYTISFWLNADRLSTYGPTVQMGRNMGAADTGDKTVAWVNFTKAEWGANSADIFPVVWDRNSSTGVWPWVYAADDAVHGKREWVLVTLVADGQKYTYAEDGLDRIGAKLYLNGEVAFDASAELALYGGLAPEIFTGDGFEAYIGINYWDTIFKGFIDELYVFDTALTDGQVLSLFEEGDINVESVAPESPNTVEEVEEVVITPVADITVDETAIDVLGATDFSLAWWTEHSDSFELADGQTVNVKLNNYSDGGANWDNFVVGFTNTKTTADLTPSADNYPGYAEYAVVRADAYGWGDASYAGAFETSWTDWNAWLSLMTDADVTIAITRNGGEIVMDTTFVGADGTEMTEKSTITSTLTDADPCYFFITGEHAYIEILSVEAAA